MILVYDFHILISVDVCAIVLQWCHMSTIETIPVRLVRLHIIACRRGLKYQPTLITIFHSGPLYYLRVTIKTYTCKPCKHHADLELQWRLQDNHLKSWQRLARGIFCSLWTNVKLQLLLFKGTKTIKTVNVHAIAFKKENCIHHSWEIDVSQLDHQW